MKAISMSRIRKFMLSLSAQNSKYARVPSKVNFFKKNTKQSRWNVPLTVYDYGYGYGFQSSERDHGGKE